MTATVTTQPSEQAIAEVLRPGGEIASVYLGRPPSTADVEWDARWHALAGKLRRDGVADHVVDAIAHAVLRTSPVRAAAGATELAAFAGADGMLGLFPLPGLDHVDFARCCGPAHVVPLLAWLQQRPPYVLVVADRAGADFETSVGGAQPPQRWSVSGPDDDIQRNTRKTPQQRRYLHRAEDSWRHNAAAVARAAAHALERTGARLLIVAGDVRAVQLMRERLPAWVYGTVDIRHIHGSRHADGSQRTRAAAVAEASCSAAAETTSRLLSRFAEQRCHGGLAVDGEAATLTALAQGRVAVLLVAPHVAAGRTAWFGAEPAQVRPVGHRPPVEWARPAAGPLVDVAIRVALLTGAQVRVLAPGDPAALANRTLADGIGALCRFH